MRKILKNKVKIIFLLCIIFFASSSQALVKINNTHPPLIKYVFLSDTQIEKGGSLNITAVVEDDGIVEQVELILVYPYGTKTETIEMLQLYETIFYYEDKYFDIGTYSFLIKAYDNDGNENHSSSYNFKVYSTETPTGSLANIDIGTVRIDWMNEGNNIAYGSPEFDILNVTIEDPVLTLYNDYDIEYSVLCHTESEIHPPGSEVNEYRIPDFKIETYGINVTGAKKHGSAGLPHKSGINKQIMTTDEGILHIYENGTYTIAATVNITPRIDRTTILKWLFITLAQLIGIDITEILDYFAPPIYGIQEQKTIYITFELQRVFP